MQLAIEEGTLDVITFGQKRDPCDSYFHKMKTVFSPEHQVNEASELGSEAIDPYMINTSVTVNANVSTFFLK